jgi:predicted alpha/beta-fold hydrolase
MITVPLFGYKDGMDYLTKASPYNRISKIKTPTFYLNALNDPFMGEVSIDYDVFITNPNVVLATNKYAGHLGYHESIFTMEQWFSKPCIDFLDNLRN